MDIRYATTIAIVTIAALITVVITVFGLTQ
jgi:hypothetical protein